MQRRAAGAFRAGRSRRASTKSHGAEYRLVQISRSLDWYLLRPGSALHRGMDLAGGRGGAQCRPSLSARRGQKGETITRPVVDHAGETFWQVGVEPDNHPMSAMYQVTRIARASARTRAGASVVQRLRDWLRTRRLVANYLAL